ncbi:hypothetical protein NUH88_10710 [Nisaea acidiphila]|uniref:Uncharacterized protein n=1 Tax=Nisaea acidiphila TaxID=1862145 RepID=A0A9J7AXM2_9PROT|nr:hypothetical protein [Nisaea acidiphila]UUX52151.1 hypothetical protein NUH88_10710 [Nisaea acidiphila]
MRFVPTILIAAALYGCGGEVQKASETGRAEQTAAVSPAPAAAEPAETARRNEPVAPEKPKRFSQAERDPSRLLDLHQADLSVILGEPSFIRRDMSAEVWQYRTEACVLDLFLYELDRGYAVTYYEFRARRDTDVARDECFVTLLRQGISRAAQS